MWCSVSLQLGHKRVDFKGIHKFKLTVFNLCLSCSPLSVSLSFKSFCFHSFFDLVSSGGCCLIFACCPARLRWTTSRPGTSLSLPLVAVGVSSGHWSGSSSLSGDSASPSGLLSPSPYSLHSIRLSVFVCTLCYPSDNRSAASRLMLVMVRKSVQQYNSISTTIRTPYP